MAPRSSLFFSQFFFLPKSLLRVTKQSRRRYNNNKKTQISRLLSGVKSQLPNIGKRKENKNREPRRNQFYRLQSIDKLSFPLQFFCCVLFFFCLLFATQLLPISLTRQRTATNSIPRPAEKGV